MGVENQKYGEDWIQNVMNSEIKVLSELNDKQKDITDKLDKPKKIANILDKVKNQLLKITKKEDIQYYKDFLTTVQNNIKDKVAPETITTEDISKDTYKVQLEYTDINTAIQTMLGSLSQKEQEFFAKEKLITNQYDNLKKTEKEKNVMWWSMEEFKNKLSVFNNWRNIAVDTKEFMNMLKENKVSIDNIDHLVELWDFMKFVMITDKKVIVDLLTKFENKIWDKTGFLSLLKNNIDFVKNDPHLIEFIDITDRDIKWLSYDTLLKTESLDSNDSKKSINTIFHRDEQMFNKLIKDFQDPEKKWQVEKIVKEYVQLSLPKENLQWTTIEIWEIKDIKKPCFNIMKDSKIVEVSTWKQDDKGQDIKQKLTPFFGDAKTWVQLTLKQTIEQNQWVKDAMGIWPDNMKQLDPKLKDLMNSTINTANWPKSITEAISSLFDSPLFLEIKQAFLAFLAMTGNDTEKQSKYAIEANFAQAQRDLSKVTETIEDKNNNKISYLKALNSLNLENKTVDWIWNPLELFANAPLVNQKEYIKAVIWNPWTRYDKDKMSILWKTTNTSNPEQQKDDSKTETIDQKDTAQEFISWKEYKELSLDSSKPGKVERKWEWDNQYLTVDGQIIPLIKGKWSLFVKWSDWQIIEKVISFDKKDNKESIAITDGEKLDMWLLEQVYKNNNISMLWDDEKSRMIIRYYMLEQSVDGKNIIDSLMIQASNLWIDQKNKVENIIANFKKGALFKKETLEHEKNPIQIGQLQIEQISKYRKGIEESLLNIKTSTLINQKKWNDTVNTRIKLMFSS